MKPIRLTIQMNAYDCYIYGGYVFFPETKCVEHLKQRGEVVMA